MSSQHNLTLSFGKIMQLISIQVYSLNSVYLLPTMVVEQFPHAVTTKAHFLWLTLASLAKLQSIQNPAATILTQNITVI